MIYSKRIFLHHRSLSCLIILALLMITMSECSITAAFSGAETFSAEITGEILLLLPWKSDSSGSGSALTAGCMDEEHALYSFSAPSSFAVGKDLKTLYVLDTPNHKLIIAPEKKTPAILYLPVGEKNNPNLYTDMAVHEDGSVTIASARENLLYRIPSDTILSALACASSETQIFQPEKIQAPPGTKSITRISTDSTGRLLLEDPENGKYWIIDKNGKLLAETGIEYQPVLLENLRMVSVTHTDTIPVKLTVSIQELEKKTVFRSFSFEVDELVQNVLLLGQTADGNYVFYIVTGKGQDAPTDAFALEVDENGKIYGKVSLPEAPETPMMRYIRMTPDNSILFARAGEDGLRITRHDLK